MSDSFHILGSGAKATVFLGFDRSTGVFVAVKELHFPSNNDEEAKNILSEVQRLQGLCHPNIIKCYGAKAHHDKVHMILEYCAGGSVARTIRYFGALSESVAKRYVADVVKGLIHLHQRGICHRDIKPENLLLTVDGCCKLGDLGSSKAMPASGGPLVSCVGTPQYMAPEVIGGEAGYGMPADIWSLGCCVYEMVLSVPLFVAANPMAVMFAISSLGEGTIDFPDHVNLSEDCVAFIKSCLCTYPEGRPEAFELLNHRWLSANSELNSQEITVDHIIALTSLQAATFESDTTAMSNSPSVPQTPSGPNDSPAPTILARASSAKAFHQPSYENAIVYDSADFEPIPEHAKTVGAMPRASPIDSSEDTSFAVASSLISVCQFCKNNPALFECDECRRVLGNMYRLCPGCWTTSHSRFKSQHAKKPLLSAPPFIPTEMASSNQSNQAKGERGVLLSNGAFVDLSAFEETGWTCGGCGRYNGKALAHCKQCGQLN